MIELPIAEDIYDLDSFALRDYQKNISNGLTTLEKEENKSKEVLTWMKKAKKLLDMISLELHERQAVEDFGEFCKRGEQYLANLDSFNPYSNDKTKQSIDNVTQKLSKVIANPIIEEPELEASTEINSSATGSTRKTSRYEETKSEAPSISDTPTKDTDISMAQKIYETMHHARKKETVKKKTKKESLFEFMKQTLNATRVQETTLAIGKSSVEGTKKQASQSGDDGFQKKDSVSVSESAQKHKVNKSVPLRKPTPGFSTKDTKTHSNLDMGSLPVSKPTKKVSSMKKETSSTTKSTKSATVERKEVPLKRKDGSTLIKQPKRSASMQEVDETSKTEKSQKITKQNSSISSQSKQKEEHSIANIQSQKEVTPSKALSNPVNKDGETTTEKPKSFGELGPEPSIEKTAEQEEIEEEYEGEDPEGEQSGKENNEIEEKIESEQQDQHSRKSSFDSQHEVSTHSQKQSSTPNVQSTQKQTNQFTSISKADDEADSDEDNDDDNLIEDENKGTTQTSQSNSKSIIPKGLSNAYKQSVSVSTKSKPDITKDTTISKITEQQKSVSSISNTENREKISLLNENNALDADLKKPDEKKYNNISDDSDDDLDDVEDDKQNVQSNTIEKDERLVQDTPRAEFLSYKMKKSQDNYPQEPSDDLISSKDNAIRSSIQDEKISEKPDLAIIGSGLSSQASISKLNESPSRSNTNIVSSQHETPSSQSKVKLHSSGSVFLHASKETEVYRHPTQDEGSSHHRSSKELLKSKEVEQAEAKKAREFFEQEREKDRLKANIIKAEGAIKDLNSTQKSTKSNSQSKDGLEDTITSTKEKPETNSKTGKAPNSDAKKKSIGAPTKKKHDFINIPDDQIVDYSNFFNSFQEIFSGYHIAKEFDYLNVMRELLGLFSMHANKVDNMDSILNKYKPALAPLEFGPNDMAALNNPNHILMYSTKTNIDLRLFIQRQQIFNQNVRIIQNPEENEPEEPANKNETLYYRVVKSRQDVYDIITRSFLRKRNWVELPHGMNLKTTWNLLWTWSKPEIDMTKLIVWQKVNHFPGNKALVRKDLLKANIEKIQKLGSKAAAAFNIIPLTFFLPKEVTKFMECFYEHIEKEGPYNIWIIKPVGKSRGRGISLANDIAQVKYSEPVVVQKYLKNPLLLDGYKFDMRIYVLVTSLTPLEVFIYKEGFARLSTSHFSLNEEDLKNLYIHLTNTSVQKYSNHADNMTSDAIIGGTKISLKTLKSRLEYKGVKWQAIWDQVCEIVVKSLLAVQGEIQQNPNCFELFGYDIIIDNNHKCWLLEVNSSPSLERMNILDDLVKQQLIDDIIDLVSPTNFDRKRLVQVLERRILEEQRCKSVINSENNSKTQLNKDLTYILHGKKMRAVGEMPEQMGNFERIAPSDMCDRLTKLIQSYKAPNRTATSHTDKRGTL